MTHKHLTGLTLIALGTLALLQMLDMYNFGLTLWPALVVWIGLEIVWGSLFDQRHSPFIFGAALGLFVAGLGLVRILANAGLPIALSTSEMLRLGWPSLLIAVGLSLMFGRSHWRWHW